MLEIGEEGMVVSTLHNPGRKGNKKERGKEGGGGVRTHQKK